MVLPMQYRILICNIIQVYMYTVVQTTEYTNRLHCVLMHTRLCVSWMIAVTVITTAWNTLVDIF